MRFHPWCRLRLCVFMRVCSTRDTHPAAIRMGVTTALYARRVVLFHGVLCSKWSVHGMYVMGEKGKKNLRQQWALIPPDRCVCSTPLSCPVLFSQQHLVPFVCLSR